MSGLIVEGLTVALGHRAILGGIDLTVAPGEVVGLIGPNGAGKSTALRSILGLIPASARTITVGGKDVRGMNHKERARALSYLPQMREVHWPITARALVTLGRYPHGDGGAPSGEFRIGTSLQAADAAQFAERDVTTLSGGELARVLFARALAVDAPVLLADEPVAALDPGHQLLAMQRLRDTAAKAAVLVVMHDLSLAARFCDRLYLLDAGRVAASGPATDVIASPALETAFGIKLIRTQIDGVPPHRPDFVIRGSRGAAEYAEKAIMSCRAGAAWSASARKA